MGGVTVFARYLGQVRCPSPRNCQAEPSQSCEDTGCLARKPALPDSLSLIHISPDTCADMPTAAAAAGTIDLAIAIALKDVSLAATAFFGALMLNAEALWGHVPAAQMAIGRAAFASKGCCACAKAVRARTTRRAPSDVRTERAQLARATGVDSRFA